MEMCLINILNKLISERISKKSEETYEDFYNLNTKNYKKVKTEENQEDIDELEYTNKADDNEEEIDEQDDAAESGTSSAGEGAGTASMGVWDSGVQRGHANPTGVGKWEDVYGLTRGKANPLW